MQARDTFLNKRLVPQNTQFEMVEDTEKKVEDSIKKFCDEKKLPPTQYIMLGIRG